MDALLIPVFVLFLAALPVLFISLLLYAVPVNAAVTLIVKENRKGYVLDISWGVFGIRTAGAEAGGRMEVFIAGHAVFSPAGIPAGGRKHEAARTGEAMPEKETSKPPSPLPAPQPLGGSRPEPVPACPPSSAPSPSGSEKGTAPGIPEIGRFADGLTNAGAMISLLRKLIGPVGSFGSAVWQQTRFVSATGTLTLGLGDPVLTGEVCGMYWAGRFAFLASRIFIDLEPVFDRAVLELDITVRIMVKHPLLVLLAGIRLALHPAVREAMGMATRRRAGVPA